MDERRHSEELIQIWDDSRRPTCSYYTRSLKFIRNVLASPAVPTQLNPDRCMIAGLGFIAHPGIHACALQVRRRVRVKQQVRRRPWPTLHSSKLQNRNSSRSHNNFRS